MSAKYENVASTILDATLIERGSTDLAHEA